MLWRRSTGATAQGNGSEAGGSPEGEPALGVGLEAQVVLEQVAHLQLEDVDPAWEKAVAAGCEVTHPLQLMFWGDRYGTLRDPFQISWSLASTPK